MINELFLGYSLMASQGPIEWPNVDLNLGFTDQMTEDFSLRFEYGYAHTDVKGKPYTYDFNNQIRGEQRTTTTHSHSLGLGAQQKVGRSMVVFGGLVYAMTPGTISVSRTYADRARHDFLVDSLHAQIGVGNRWELGEKFYLGVDWFVLSSYITERISVDNINDLPQSQYSIKHDVLTQISILRELRLMRLNLTYDF